MALSKQKKSEIVEEVKNLISTSKLTVLASYPGTSVQDMQELRKEAIQTNSVVRVVKNRLFLKALAETNLYPDINIEAIKGQLLYAFNSDDEVAPAKTLADFAKKHQSLEFVGALTPEGNLLEATEVKQLADLPSKDQLRSLLVGTIGAPLSGLVNVMIGNVRGILNVLNERADALASK